MKKEYKKIIKEKEKLVKDKQNLEKDNKKLKNNIKLNSMNENQIIKNNIKESQIFMNNTSCINKSLAPLNLPGQSLKGSIMPIFDVEEIREENEEEQDNKNENTNTNKILTKKDSDELGSNYMADENEDEEKLKEDFIKEKKKKIKQSRLKMSFKSNIFDFTNEKDENYINDLKNEINDLYKKRDRILEDNQLKEQKIEQQEKKFQESLIQNVELKRIIEEKNKEIERLKNK